MPSHVPPDENENWLLGALKSSHRAGLIPEEFWDETLRHRLKKEGPFGDIHRKEFAARIQQKRGMLTSEEIEILRKLYGLDGECSRSIDELVHELHRPPAEIVEIEQQAVRKFRPPTPEPRPRSLYIVKRKDA